MSSETMHQIIEIVEAGVRSRPSSTEFEMAYQTRVAIDRIKFAIKHMEQFSDPAPRFATPTCSYSTPWVVLRRWIGASRSDLEPWQTETEVLRA